MTPDIKRLASNMRRRKLDDYRLYRLLLMPLAQTSDLLEGYQHLAWLLREGYLATIVTLNADTLLEKVLSSARIPAKILDIGKDTVSSIADALEDPPPGICIVKLSLKSTINTQMDNNPSLLPDELHASLKIYLQNAIVIVGSVHQDSALVQILRSISIKSLYYVLPQPPPADDVLEEIRREKKQEIFSICDLDGEFTPFFAALISSIQNDSPTSSSPIPFDDRGPIDLHSVPTTYQAVPDQNVQRPIILYNEPIHMFRETVIPSNRVQRKSKMVTDILLATVTAIETQAVLELFPGYQEVSIRKKIYFDLGLINDLRVVLFQQPHMGSTGTAGSHMSIKEAINALSPLYVIMVGIAFGIDSDTQNIGDILISRHIQDYDPQRVSLGADSKPVFEPRGDRVMASPHLLDLFIAGQYSLPNVWAGKPPKINFGLILSGSKLVDHLDYRDELRRFAPDAIGGEMEGIGLYHAASERKVHWILIKAICDWADGNKHVDKNDRQRLAASNAAIFTHHVLQRGGFERHRTKKIPRRNRPRG